MLFETLIMSYNWSNGNFSKITVGQYVLCRAICRNDEFTRHSWKFYFVNYVELFNNSHSMRNYYLFCLSYHLAPFLEEISRKVVKKTAKKQKWVTEEKNYFIINFLYNAAIFFFRLGNSIFSLFYYYSLGFDTCVLFWNYWNFQHFLLVKSRFRSIPQNRRYNPLLYALEEL